MTGISVNVDGIQGLDLLFAGLESAVDVDSGLADVSAVLLNRIKTRFLDTERPDGSQWPVSAASIGRDLDPQGGGKTLFDSGKLFQSIQAARSAPGEYVIGTDVPYSLEHQLGTNGQLEREFLGFNQDDNDAAVAVIDARISRALGL